MGDFADFLDMIRGREPRSKAEKGLTITTTGESLKPGGFVNEIRVRGSDAYPRSDTESLQGVRTQNELAFACIGVRSGTAQDPRLVVQQRVKREDGSVGYDEMPDHPFRRLIMRPNSSMTEADLMRAAIVSWDISNPRRVYCEKEYTNNLLTAIYPLNPAFMKARKGRSGEVIGYVWNDGKYRKEYMPEDLIIRSAPSWYDPPPLTAALGSVGSDTAQTDYVRAFFENGGTPPGYLKMDIPLSQGQKDDIRAQWMDRYGNAYGRQHGIGVLDRDADYQRIGTNLGDLSSEVLRSVSESRVCMVFGVPPLIVYAYVGLIRATYSNLREAWAGFWDATMSPLFKEWRAFWTWNLLTEFEDEADVRAESVRLDYDLSRVAALQDDVEAAQSRTRNNFKTGLITLNEARSQIGAVLDPNGDYYVRNLVFVPTQFGASSDEATAAIPPKSRLALIKSKAGRNKPSLQVTERRIERSMQNYLKDEYDRAARLAEAS